MSMANQVQLLDASGRPLPRVGANAYTAGSLSNDLRRWDPITGSADSDLLPELGRIVSRSRDLTRNNGVADGARQRYQDNIIGCGLRLSAKPDWRLLKKNREWAEEWGNNVESWWRTWWANCAVDVAHKCNGDGLTVQGFNSAFLNGAALALPLWLPGRGNRFSTCLQLIEPDRLSNPDDGPDTDRRRGGIDMDDYGRPLVYNIRKAHPGDARYSSYWSVNEGLYKWERIPAMTEWGRRRVLHVPQNIDRPAQSRGKPSLTSGMRQFKMLTDVTGAELKAMLVNAMVAMVVESSLDQDRILELLSSNPDALKQYQAGLANRDGSRMEFQGAQIVNVPLGTKVGTYSPGRPSNSFEAFVKSLFRHIATGLHIPYELLMLDFSETNYSSARAALLEAWRFFRGRRKWLADGWLSPIYALWLEECVDLGLVDAPDFYENWEAYCTCKWIGDGRGWIDPLKEAQAADLRNKLCITTLEDECAEQGGDWQENLEQIARELAYKKKLEEQYQIRFPGVETVNNTAGAHKDDDEPGGGSPPGRPAKQQPASPASAGLAA